MSAITEHESYFTCLPREYYYSQEIYDREIERILERQWLYFGHVSQLPQAGDYLVREMVGESVIVMRTEDGSVRASLNVCRHRGARLCEDGIGHARRGRITCPYHQWSYDGTDGRLVNAPSVPAGESIDYGDWGLYPVQVDTWQGFIFICLGTEPLEPLAQLFAASADAFEAMAPLKVAHTTVYDIAANWKIVVENGTECYHCPGNHPEFSKAADVQAIFNDSLEIPPMNGEGSGPTCESEEAGHDVDASMEYGGGEGLLLRGGVKSFTVDGELACTKLLREFGEEEPPSEGCSSMVYAHPAMIYINFFADYGFAFNVLPVSIDRTQLTATWYVREDAEEGTDYDLDHLRALVHVTTEQDKVICEELVQAGTSSRRYVPGPLSRRREPALRDIMALYLERLGE